MLDQLHTTIIKSIKMPLGGTISHSIPSKQHIPGWNESAKGKHCAARKVYVC